MEVGKKVNLSELRVSSKAGDFEPLSTSIPFAAAQIPKLRYSDAQLVIPQHVQVVLSLYEPVVSVFANFMTAQECQEVIELARPRLSRSVVVDRDNAEVSETRRSESAGFSRGETALISSIEQRIAAITHTSVDQGEGLNVIRYRANEEYRPHMDYFPANFTRSTLEKSGGNRIASLIIYLNTVPQGGATEFPLLGIKINAVRANACYFAYLDEQGRLDRRLLHAGTPVLQGEKWIAVKWLRQIPFNVS